VIEYVGAFGDEMGLVVAERCNDGFYRLFAQLLGNLRRAALQQLGRVGLRGVGTLARLDLGEERIKRVGGRGQLSRSPACEPK